jgi:antirestriction protein ArdC
MTAAKRDLYAEVTASIVGALETAGEWQRPWTLAENGAAAPRNADGRHYRGVNTLLLWASAMEHGWTSGVWGTYRAWVNHGAQVRKGEKGTLVVLWKPARRSPRGDEVPEDDGKVGMLLLRHFTVFAAEQVDGYELPPVAELPVFERDAAADEFFSRVGADVRYGGDTAAWSPTLDYIICPEAEQFIDREHFYSTLAHEHGHWTGHKSRLDRDLSGRFGGAAYAAEELVAELTAAYVAARLGFHPQVRDDHAAYVKNWVTLLKDDDRAIFTAASKAQQACDYLVAAGSTAEALAGALEEVTA